MKISWKMILILAAALCLLVSAASGADVYDKYLSPWKSADIGAETREAGELRFYFMAGEGFITQSKDEPEKWGDSCLVVFPTGELMLIDSGMPDYAPILVKNLKQLGVKKIDYLVVTHPHEDHAGGVYAPGGLLEQFEIGVMLYNGVYNAKWNNPYRLEMLLDGCNFPREIVSEGWSMDIGEVHLQVISPSPDIVGTISDNTDTINNSSIVLRIDYEDVSALFTGDIYQRKEDELVREKSELIDVDLLKMPHHGEYTSNTKDFAQAVSPKLAVATGQMFVQDYLYKNYTRTGARVLMDLLDGYIRVWTDGENLEWDQSRERQTDHFDSFEYENLKKKK